MADAPCYCGHYMLNPQDATYVKNFKPLCHPVTCERAVIRVAAEQRRLLDDPHGNELED
jgi:hypothetical protein